MITTKSIFVAATLAIATCSGALAADNNDQPGWRHHMTAEDRAALLDARIAALKAGLKLTPDQDKNWAPVEAAIREQAKERAARFAAWREQRDNGDVHMDLIERLQHRSENLTTRAADLQKLIGAAKPLYDSLDDGQKRRFAMLLRASFGHRHQHREG
ncbi:MAG TPA: Spy/CpxP family protein refolding chaperone [Roseiarcus sp.]|jgi:hypothetical protein